MVNSFSRKRDNPEYAGIDPDEDKVFKNLGVNREMIEEFESDLGKNMEDVMRMLTN
jgi:hypothetical protein